MVDEAFNELTGMAADHYSVYTLAGGVSGMMLSSVGQMVEYGVKAERITQGRQLVGILACEALLVYGDVGPFFTIPVGIYGLYSLRNYLNLLKYEKLSPLAIEELRSKMNEKIEDATFVMDAVVQHPHYDSKTTMDTIAALSERIHYDK